ncbi:MAG: ammonium transporter [Phycisphaerae bacterium]|jgi:Amt family ammonium transporter
MKHLITKLGLLVLLALIVPVFAEDESAAITDGTGAVAVEADEAAGATAALGELTVGVDTVWILLGAVLVFFMQPGFAMVETGFVRAKNACNILTKNFLDFCIASIAFFAVGYAFMFGEGNSFIGLKNFFLTGVGHDGAAFWLFQAAFCGTAATIVSGSVAERIHFKAYILYTIIISAVVYPIIGHWVWGGGWLSNFGGGAFLDFAGSGVVHTVGGVAGLIGAILLGARRGRFAADGTPKAIAGHNIPMVTLGVFILWFGWFGFNAGSTLAVGDGSLIGLIALNTNIAAASGGIVAITFATIKFGKPDLSMGMNGALAGLVSITAPCAFVEPWAAIVIGAIGGFLVVLAVMMLDKLRIDDPVGAFPVHGVCGIWGCLANGFFATEALAGSAGLLYGGGLGVLWIQFAGIASIIAFTAVTMFITFKIIDVAVGLRVSEEEELRGLDITEHGMESYAGFQIFNG